jgi:hypothetical protein
MSTVPDTNAWSGAVQRELDALQRSTDVRFVEFSTRLDKLLTLTEYHADLRGSDIRNQNISEKIHDSELDITALKTELRQSLDLLRNEIQAERTRFELALARETEERKEEHSSYLKEKKEQFRWFVSLVMIPLAIAIVDLLVNKH